ncbi:cyclase family protein [Ramlibacter sp. PS3R-8]|uniref:cyclase family protein n=1 Tax=Ramlibacter sp. PS3R-8 TaxID=3133437 RepID=UPI0030A95074
MPPSPPRWSQRPPGSNWGDFGPDDQLGRLNLITPEKVRQGVAEVKDGRSFCLSLPLDYPGGSLLNPARHPPVLRPTLRQGTRVNFNFRLAQLVEDRTDVISDDLAILHLQYSTQWDSLAHVGSMFDADGDGLPEPVYYNGYRAQRDVLGPADAADAGALGPDLRSTSSAHALGIQNMAEKAMQGRAVLIDLHAHFGDARTLIGYEQLVQVLGMDGVVVEPGDIVCFHTGFAQALLGMGKQPTQHALEHTGTVLDGRDERLLQWITDTGVAAIAADNYAVEALPARHRGGCCAALPLHEHCLFKLGVHLGELWWLTPLAQHLRKEGRSRFLLTAPPLRLPGAVGSPVTPVGTT